MRRLLIVADHSFIVQAIRLALRQSSGFDVVGYADGRQPIQAGVARTRPDVVLIDDMQSPEQALDRLREAGDLPDGTPTPIRLLLTLDMDAPWLDEAFAAGADAVMSKSVHPVAMGTLLRETVRRNIVHRHRPARVEPDLETPLTPREAEILRLAARGLTNGRIARQLWITEQTVKFHLSNTYRKLGVSNRTEASHYAFANALTSVDELETLAS
jgi:DNA-binding NarL/FixJ family response regulator